MYKQKANVQISLRIPSFGKESLLYNDIVYVAIDSLTWQ